ncbi:MAG: inositol monophosphatase family protein [Cyclobacteriaceae bacterium]
MDIQQICKSTKGITLEVGEFIRQECAAFDLGRVEKKGKNDLVSYVDKEAETRLVKQLRAILPSAGFITEEGTTEQLSAKHRWVIDPLDGTTNFIHGLPIFSISIALMNEDKVDLGIVYEVNRQECFHAIRGQGAWCNDAEMRVSEATSIGESLLATGFPYYNFEKLSEYLSILNELMKNTHGLRRMGSAAVDLAYVACGRYEGYFEFNLNSWDVAAGTLLVEEAGGRVTDFSGGDQFVFGRELVSGNPAVQQELLGIIKKFW